MSARADGSTGFRDPAGGREVRGAPSASGAANENGGPGGARRDAETGECGRIVYFQLSRNLV